MLPPQIRLSIFQTECDDDIGLDGTEPYPKIRTNNGSTTDPIHAILLQSTILVHFVKSRYKQFKLVKTCHVRNLDSCEFWSIKQIKLLQTTKQQQIR